MNDRLHEIIAKIGVFHNTLIKDGLINNLDIVYDKLDVYEDDFKEHYLKLLMQYYFQNNNLKNLQELLLEGFKFDLRFNDIAIAFTNIKEEDSVIEFYEDQSVLLKDIVIEDDLYLIKEYYDENENLHNILDFPLKLIKRNRYVCAKAYKYKGDLGDFFINEDLLKSLKEDMPYLLK